MSSDDDVSKVGCYKYKLSSHQSIRIALLWQTAAAADLSQGGRPQARQKEYTYINKSVKKHLQVLHSQYCVNVRHS